MNKGTFTYSLLQYHHSQILGEVLNIGLLVYFPELKRLEFIYPEKLLRLRFAYPDVPEKTVKAYLRHFSNVANTFNARPDMFADHELFISLKAFVEKEFLPPDASALQFGAERTSVLYTTNIEHLLNQLYNLYFSVFAVNDSAENRIDETILLKRYKDLIKEYSKSGIQAHDKLHFDYSISPPASFEVKFDVAWESAGELHLVKPVSFDLSRADIIAKKAYQFSGQYLDLEDFATDQNYLFDVIVARPEAKDLFKSYDHAIRLLQKPRRVNLIEEADLSSYSRRTVEAVA